MNKVSCAVMLAAMAGLSGCATPYGGSGLTGGYTEGRVNDRLLKVNFFGNAYVTADKIQTFALYRCAEVARDAKKPYFTLYDSLTAAARDLPSAEPRVGSLGGKPIAFALMALEDGPRPGAHEVSAVLAKLAPLVQPGPDAGRTQR